ncbi:MAG: hypothetical protein ACHQ49_04620 [Elusimicrobiota bacterium]
MAWAKADNGSEDPVVTAARHDLIIGIPEHFKLKWDGEYPGSATVFTQESVVEARDLRAKLLSLNPNVLLVAEIRAFQAPDNYLPPKSSWWARGADGRPLRHGIWFQLDRHDAAFQAQAARQCKAVLDAGVADGCVFGPWSDDSDDLRLIKTVRAVVGGGALLMAMVGEDPFPETAGFFNGAFFPPVGDLSKPEAWNRLDSAWSWTQGRLSEPKLVAAETVWPKSRNDRELMRLFTAFAMVHPNGYALFADPGPPLAKRYHEHAWYPFWNKALGRPNGPARAQPDGAVVRDFERGSVVYNAIGNKAAAVRFDEKRRRATSGVKASSFSVAPGTGDMFLRL